MRCLYVGMLCFRSRKAVPVFLSSVLIYVVGGPFFFNRSAFTDAEDAETSRPSILEAITSLKEKMAAAEELLGATSQALLRTNIEVSPLVRVNTITWRVSLVL